MDFQDSDDHGALNKVFGPLTSYLGGRGGGGVGLGVRGGRA